MSQATTGAGAAGQAIRRKRPSDSLVFKVAEGPEEFRQIRELNYRTFVEEIPQHSPNADRELRDRYDDENTYFICRFGDRIVGMIAVRSRRPFSLDAKLPGLDQLLPPHRSPCEVRLLAVEPSHRQGRVMAGLVGMVHAHFQARGHDIALISGTLRQARLYQHLGFTPFGPQVGTAEAPYQPMYQFADDFRKRAAALDSTALQRLLKPEVNLLPGPVYLAPATHAALAAKPVSHRSGAFTRMLEQTRRRLCAMTHAPAVSIAVGSGTMANDLVGGQIAQWPGRGVVLANGEFGRRLVDHARRWGLDFDVVEAPWGEPFEPGAIERAVGGKGIGWIWGVHAETSTGVLNDLDLLKRLAQAHGCRLALDCVSAVGMVPCDLRGVELASAVSGKGLRSIAGLALVFHGERLPDPVRPLPRYLDLAMYRSAGVPFTLPSNLLGALSLAVEQLDPAVRYREVRETADWICAQLETVGVRPLAAPSVRFPGALTLVIPRPLSSLDVGDDLARDGWLLSYESGYLVEQNWIQICLMGAVDRAHLESLPAALAACLRPDAA